MDYTQLLLKYLKLMKEHTCDNFTLQGLLDLNHWLLGEYLQTHSYEEILSFSDEHKLLDEFFFQNLYYLPERTKGLK
jgi:hypothetical protein